MVGARATEETRERSQPMGAKTYLYKISCSYEYISLILFIIPHVQDVERRPSVISWLSTNPACAVSRAAGAAGAISAIWKRLVGGQP